MSFRIVEVDLNTIDAAANVELGADETGLALIVRDGDAIVGFEMRDRKDLPADGSVAPIDLIADETRRCAISERLRRQLAPENLVPPRISIAICSKDRPHWVARVLTSLMAQPAPGPHEIIVVDNAPSNDETRKVVEATEGVRYVMEPLAGLDFARNAAIRNATGDVLAYLDDDVVVDRAWLAGIRRAWAHNPDAGGVTGQVLPLMMETEAQILFERRTGFRGLCRPRRFGTTAFRNHLHPCGSGDFGVGANMSFRLELLRRLGGFDEALDTGRPLPGGGDLDIFYRVVRSGCPLVYEPQMAVRHEHRRDMKALQHQYYTWGLGFAAYIVKNMQSDPEMRGRLRAMTLWFFAYHVHRIGGALFGREPAPLSMVVAEIWGGLVGLCGEYGRSQKRSAAIRMQTT